MLAAPDDVEIITAVYCYTWISLAIDAWAVNILGRLPRRGESAVLNAIVVPLKILPPPDNMNTIVGVDSNRNTATGGITKRLELYLASPTG